MARYGNNIGDETAPAWYHRWERERREEELARIGQIDYEQLLVTGSDYMDAENRYRGNKDFRGLYLGGTLSGVKREAFEASIRAEWAEHALYIACYITGIPENAVVRAARIEARYYDRGGSKVLDSKRLILSQV